MKTKPSKERIIRSGEVAHLVRNGAIVDSVDFHGEKTPMLRRIFKERQSAKEETKHAFAGKIDQLKSLIDSLQSVAA